jgi:oligopeptide transport system substrate-binding protein
VLERGNGPEPDSLDPQRAQGLSAHHVLRDIYQGLTRIDAEGQVQPAAAARIERLDGGRRWCFELHPGLHWSDGRPLQLADYAAALARALDPLTGAPYATLLLPLEGARERLAGQSEAPLGLQLIAANRLCMQLDAPTLDWPARLALPLGYPHRADNTGALPLGNGPYRLREWRRQSRIVLERNPWYGGLAPFIDEVRLHVIEDPSAELNRYAAGELHLTETIPPGQAERLARLYPGQLHIGPAYASFYYGYNLERPPLKDNPALREALSLALDRDVLVRHITGNGEQPLWRLIPPLPGEPASAPPLTSTQERHALARQRYAEAGYGADHPLQIELRYNTSLSHRRLALAVAAQWRQNLGVQTRLRHEEWKVFVSNRRARRVTEVFRAGWVADYVDPISFLEGFASDSPLNATGYRDARFDALLRAASQSTLAAERRQLLRAAEERLLSAQVILPIYAYTSKHLVSPQLCGFAVHPLDHHPSAELYFCSNEQAGTR